MSFVGDAPRSKLSLPSFTARPNTVFEAIDLCLEFDAGSRKFKASAVFFAKPILLFGLAQQAKKIESRF